MPSRRSVLTFLGLAPIAASAAIAAAARPELVIVGADVTEAGITVGPATIVTPTMCRAYLLRAYNHMTFAEFEATRALVSEAQVGVSSLDLAGAFGSRSPLGDDDRDTRAGAATAARGDQGDGGDAATAAPSQSVEKVVPGATGDGDGLTSASGPGIVPGSNSPDGASEVSLKRPEETGGCVRPDGLYASATEKPLGVTFGGFESETATSSLSAWARAGLQNQAPGVRLLPAVPAARGA